uniref:Uncharacterized protein TCIL3000_11_15950 n=1 Tax=Trypanosoma congolense (strain IL3000) TaxID=1068625 RepID=G0V362_TRYCI|nr:unnamed protein product [Trypanosoma congolense IL3000]
MEIGDSNEGEVLTGAELFYYLSKRNKDQLDDCRRKLGEYTRLVDILQSITDRCHVPILAPVASGAAYFEAKIEYTNNILVLLGDNWFAERSAKQAREIAERRLEFLRGEENALLAEECALAQRQELFFSEFPNAEKAMAEVEAAKQAAFESRSKKCTRESTCAVQVQASQASVGVSPQTKANESLTSSGPEPSAMAAQPSLTTSLGPDDQELAVF